jgi:hypothetical protein
VALSGGSGQGVGRRGPRDGGGRIGRRTAALLFVALGLVGAFVASAVAGLWSEDPPESGLRALGVGVDDPASIRVEVLNGAGAAGLAREATIALRAQGFDVVFFGNASRFDHSRSVVLDRVGDGRPATAVAAALGIDSVMAVVDSSLMLEVTVVLGDDWPPDPVVTPGWSDRLRTLVGRDSAAQVHADSVDGG